MEVASSGSPPPLSVSNAIPHRRAFRNPIHPPQRAWQAIRLLIARLWSRGTAAAGIDRSAESVGGPDTPRSPPANPRVPPEPK